MSKVVTVRFNSGHGGYDFKTDIEDLKVGDKVVVHSLNSYEVATVTRLKASSSIAHKYVVQKIDAEAHQQRLAKEAKLKEVKEKMEERRKQLQEAEIYRILAKEDESMAALLKEYEELA
jgi:hypothetical protein